MDFANITLVITHGIWRIGDGKFSHRAKCLALIILSESPNTCIKAMQKKMILQMLDIIQKVGAKQVLVDPDKNNTASNKLLESCGFSHNGKCYIIKTEVANELD